MDVINVYDEYINKKNRKLEEERYDDYKDWFHASGSGSCARKHYFRNVEKFKGNPKSLGTMRLFRLGNIVHEDIQAAVSEFAIDNKTTIYIEHEIRIPDLNVRGFLDMVMVEDNELYDIKTCNAANFRKIFGKSKSPYSEPINYYMQVGTYGHWYELEKGKPLDKLALLYYNKDTSEMRELRVPRSYMQKAIDYWTKVKNEFRWGVPDVKLGFAPCKKWECNPKYCDFYAHCGGGLDK